MVSQSGPVVMGITNPHTDESDWMNVYSVERACVFPEEKEIAYRLEVGEDYHVYLVGMSEGVESREEIGNPIKTAYIISSMVYSNLPIEEHPVISEAKKRIQERLKKEEIS